MLGLVQQVGREQRTSALPSAITRLSDGPRIMNATRPVALHLDLRRLHRRAPRTEHLEHLRDRLRAERERGDAGRAVRAEDVAQPELVRDDEHGGIDLAARAGTGGTTTAISGTPATTAGVRSARAPTGTTLAAREYSPALAIAVVFSPSIRPGSSSMRSRRPRHALVVARARVDALTDRAEDSRATRGPCPSTSSSRRAGSSVDLAAVEARHRAHDRLVAVRAHVLDDLEHSLAHRGIEDAPGLAREQPRARARVERRPAQLAQRAFRHSCLHRS